jgi:hypothetical protein
VSTASGDGVATGMTVPVTVIAPARPPASPLAHTGIDPVLPFMALTLAVVATFLRPRRSHS